MNKFLMLGAAAMSLSLGMNASVAEAGPFDKLKKAAKKVERAANEVEKAAEDAKDAADTVEAVSKGQVPTRRGGVNSVGRDAAIRQGMAQRSNYPKTAKGKAHAGRAAPAPAKYTSLTKCAGLPISNAFIAQNGTYTFQNGLNSEERTGLIDREPVSASNGCIMPSMGTYDVLYMEVPTAQYDKMKYDMQMQCIDQSTGKQNPDNMVPSWNNVSGKDVALHTGHSLGYKTTASGSNSDRSAAWDKDLKSRGKTMLGFNMPPLHTDAGTDFYCQYYNKASGKSVAAFAYRRSAGNR